MRIAGKGVFLSTDLHARRRGHARSAAASPPQWRACRHFLCQNIKHRRGLQAGVETTGRRRDVMARAHQSETGGGKHHGITVPRAEDAPFQGPSDAHPRWLCRNALPNAGSSGFTDVHNELRHGNHGILPAHRTAPLVPREQPRFCCWRLRELRTLTVTSVVGDTRC